VSYYVFAATAIPALWVACGLLKHDGPRPRWLIALVRTILRITLASAEVAAVTVLAVGHDGAVAAALTVLGLAAGTVAAVARSATGDLNVLRVPHEMTIAACVTLFVLVAAYATSR
jgi:hypothetical protein